MSLVVGCACAAQTTATTQEAAVCDAVEEVIDEGSVLVSGAVPPGDPRTLERLAAAARGVGTHAAKAQHGVLRDAGRDLVEAAEYLAIERSDHGTQTVAVSTRGLMAALRALELTCAELGVATS